jgi:CRISPR-associated protein Cmr2
VNDPEKGELCPSMSYGVSVTYYKYPLYEALNLSRDLLFKKAKNVAQKNAIAWTLQKGSGSAFSGEFSKNNAGLSNAFYRLIDSIDATSIDGNMVSAVAHKLKENQALLQLFMGKPDEMERLNAFFDVTLEYKSKKIAEKAYLDATRGLLPITYQVSKNKVLSVNVKRKNKKDDKKIIEEISNDALDNMYGMLRTAKFIKGLEEDKDE